jgi:uncharacterized protein
MITVQSNMDIPEHSVGRHTIDRWLLHATDFLPSQGPITVFVHHNTLHAFENLSFDEGVLEGLRIYNSQPYFSEDRFRQEMQTGRIRLKDLEQVLLDDLGNEADRLVASFGTRYQLRLAMMQYPLRTLPDRELTWLIAEGGALQEFFCEVESEDIRSIVEKTRNDLYKYLRDAEKAPHPRNSILPELLNGSSVSVLEAWTEAKWKSFTLEYLWAACKQGVQSSDSRTIHNGDAQTPLHTPTPAEPREADRLVNDFLIRFCGCYLDQGFATWPMPDREHGFLNAFCSLYGTRMAMLPSWLKQLPTEIARIRSANQDAYEVVQEELRRSKLDAHACEELVKRKLLALRGWAGMIWQMETAAPWTPKPAPAGSLVGYLAVRLILDRLVMETTQSLSQRSTGVRQAKRPDLQSHAGRSIESRAFTIFQIAQFRKWTPSSLVTLNAAEWTQLLKEVDAFSSLQRRRVFQLAYERRYRVQALDAVAVHSRKRREKRLLRSSSTLPKFQVITCIDDREESFRRHLEEVESRCETFGAAGFFAVVMYYRGAAEAHFRPLCPINIVPKHYVCEEPAFSAELESDKRTQRRKFIGRVSHQVHSGSRTFLGGMLTGLFGTLATFPLVARVLAPHITSRIRDSIGGLVRPPATELHLERVGNDPGPEWDSQGYSTEEMAGIVVRILQDIGLVKDFSPIILFLGHGSSSLNNPHESAYNCGACSGGRGGPNARAFASMANDSRVRELVANVGIHIPDDVRFIGGFHNTCNDRVDYYDLDRLPWQLRALFRDIQVRIDEARAKNAQERVRRFESARFGLTPSEALKHVEERSEDLSQARPEYNHATNALCFVGEREWSRGLFLDRRAFLASYDPNIDDENGKIVERILQAAIPVCGGINLEYYFSTVDPEGYGCGSKLPHNIASLAGVMTGAASDLRPGLSAQMVEIHEPMRILFVVQTTPQIMQRIVKANPAIRSLVEGDWVQLALIDVATSQIMHYVKGEFVQYHVQNNSLAEVGASSEMVQSERGHLPFATIREAFGDAISEVQS